MELSKNLPEERIYIKLKKNKKQPLKDNWNNPNTAGTKEQATEWLKQGYNVGLLLGSGLVCIDCDSLELQLAVEQLIKTPTYTQQSAKRRLNQYIFRVEGYQESLELKFKSKPMGEILADTTTGKGKQVVLSPSKYKITEKDIKNNPELNLKLGDIRDYTILNDISIVLIDKKELLNVIFEFESKINQKIIKETQEFKLKSGIDNLNITSVLSTAGMQQDSRGQYYGSNPFHSSTTGHNFWINTNKNLAYCFRCNTALSPAKCIALSEGIIKNCDDNLRGSDFIKVLGIAKKKYGVNDEHLTQDTTDKQTEAQEKIELDFWTLKDYRNYKESQNYIIKDLVYPAEISMNYGQTGSLKSANMLYKAVCIATGKKYLGKFKTKKNNVAILSAENSVLTDRERLLAICRGLKIRRLNNLYILRRAKCGDILNTFYKTALFDFLEKNNIKVLFLDTINPLTPELEDISTKEVTKLFNEFLKPISEAGIYVEFLHHTDKQGKMFLGSTKFKANCDCVTRIDRINDLSNTFELINEKNRAGENNTLKIEIDFIPLKPEKLKIINFKLVDDTGKPKIWKKKRQPDKSDKLKVELIKMLPKKTQISRKEIMELLDNGNIEYTTATLDRILKDKDVFNTIERGFYELK